MRTIIRKSVFETNSSSMHSLVIAKKPETYDKKKILDDLWLRKDGTWHPSDGDMEFGRTPFDVLTNLPQKTLYAIAEFCQYKDDEAAAEEFNKIRKIVTDFVPEIKDIILPEHSETQYYDKHDNPIPYSKLDWENGHYYYTGKRGGKHRPKESYVMKPYYGDVDHQSAGMLQDFLKKKNISLKEFLTSPKYWIIIDGDEYCTWDHLKKSGVIDLSNIEYDSSTDESETAPSSGEDPEITEWLKEQDEKEKADEK